MNDIEMGHKGRYVDVDVDVDSVRRSYRPTKREDYKPEVPE